MRGGTNWELGKGSLIFNLIGQAQIRWKKNWGSEKGNYAVWVMGQIRGDLLAITEILHTLICQQGSTYDWKKYGFDKSTTLCLILDAGRKERLDVILQSTSNWFYIQIWAYQNNSEKKFWVTTLSQRWAMS